MTDDKTRHAGMADDNGAMGNADDERLLMMLGEALGDKPGDEETQAAWRRFEARHGAVRRRSVMLRRAAMVLSAAAAVAVVLWLWPWSKPDEVFDVGQVVVEGQSVLYSEHDGTASAALVLVQIRRRTGNADIPVVVLDNSFNLVENEVCVFGRSAYVE